MGSFETIFIIFIMMFLAFSMRVVAQQERIAVFRFGRYIGLKGPGVVMVIPYMDRSCKIAIGERGELLAEGTGRFGEFQLPVVTGKPLSTGSSIRVVGFTKDGIQVAA